MKVSFAKDSTGAPEIIDTNNYYPFGLNHISGSFSTSGFGSFYSYKYNGKELQENGMYDYGARMYMPDLGRWGTTDPLAEGFRRFSPYHYGADNPVMFIDPDGMRNVPYDGGMISNIPEGSWWFAGMNGSFTPDYIINSGLGKRTGGGSPQTFGETQTYKDIMAYLAEPEKEYFKEIDFSVDEAINESDDGGKKNKGKAEKNIPGDSMNWFNMGDGGLYLVAENDKKIQNNTIRIFAHGYPDGMKGPNGKMIHQPDELLVLLEKYSPTWNAFKQKGGSIILDLRVCNIGRSEYSFAHRLSQDPAFKNVVIIGPADYYIASPDGKRAHVGGPGNYNIFLNGKLVRGTYNKKKL